MPKLNQTELDIFNALTQMTLFDEVGAEAVDGILAMLETEREQKAMLFFLNTTQRKLDITDVINYAFYLENNRLN